MNEVTRLREALERLDRIFTYPVSKEIDPKGYRLRPVQADAISFAVETIRAALPLLQADQHEDRGSRILPLTAEALTEDTSPCTVNPDGSVSRPRSSRN